MMSEADQELGPRVRRLMRASDRAALATGLAGDGWPYASLVLVSCDQAAAPLLLISDLAEHTQNITADPRASLLYDGTAGLESPLTGLRASVQGRLAKVADDALLARYVRHHPDAEDYVGFADFNLYRMAVERAHVVAGFGAINWLDADAVLAAVADSALADREEDIVAHMNEDHADAVGLYATHLLGLDGDGWTMTGVDAEGCDLRLGGVCARLDFDRPVADAASVRAALVALVDEARKTR